MTSNDRKYSDEEPLVSVIIPVYNRKEWLKDAINSVLNQTYKNIEIIVVDDGSTEDIHNMEIMKNENIKYYRNENHGVGYSRNFGIKKANGKYIAFLDSDDFWAKEKIKTQVKEMILNDAKWSQHSYYYYDDMKKQIIKKVDTYMYRNNPEKHQFCSFRVQTSCFMVERNAIIKDGIFFDESKTFGEDSVFYQKMLKNYKLLCINNYLGYFRIRADNTGKDIKKQIKSRVDCWRENKDTEYFIKNTTVMVRFAYRLCVIANFLSKKVDNKIVLMVLYLFPWMIFRIESKMLNFHLDD